MKLETKYGTLEGTVEEFKELLEGKLGKWYRLPTKGYKVANKDIEGTLIKGTVLKHIIANNYEDTTGNQYIVHDNDLDDCNDNHIKSQFNNSKRLGTLLRKEITTKNYKVVKEDLFLPVKNDTLKEGTVLKELQNGEYIDSLGNRFSVSNTSKDNYLRDVL
ncbi:hypothetical protein KQUDLBSD_CDS0191 [Staphylococcus phage PG-2021_40]